MSKSKFSRSNWLILILFGLIGQIAWSVENMYFNLYVFDEISPNLSAVTLMVQLSGIVATVAIQTYTLNHMYYGYCQCPSANRRMNLSKTVFRR